MELGAAAAVGDSTVAVAVVGNKLVAVDSERKKLAVVADLDLDEKKKNVNYFSQEFQFKSFSWNFSI
jgi:hypothetical protein